MKERNGGTVEFLVVFSQLGAARMKHLRLPTGARCAHGRKLLCEAHASISVPSTEKCHPQVKPLLSDEAERGGVCQVHDQATELAIELQSDVPLVRGPFARRSGLADAGRILREVKVTSDPEALL
jgi:hypothetical protein